MSGNLFLIGLSESSLDFLGKESTNVLKLPIRNLFFNTLQFTLCGGAGAGLSLANCKKVEQIFYVIVTFKKTHNLSCSFYGTVVFY